MQISEIKQEIHSYIDQADDRVLTMIYSMLKADSKHFVNDLTADQVAELRADYAKAIKGEGKEFTSEEVFANARNSRK